MTADKYVKLGRGTALISFLTGTIILLLYFISQSGDLAFMGLFFSMLAGLVNVIVLILIIIKAAIDQSNSKKLLASAGLMLLNIPIVFLYFFVGGLIANTLRITFNNSTKSVLTDIHINGCGAKYIDKLNAGENKTVWIKIPGDCGVDIDYMQNGIRKRDSLANYITNEGGQQINYNIGGHNDPF